jgi:hypothetical protein
MGGFPVAMAQVARLSPSLGYSGFFVYRCPANGMNVQVGSPRAMEDAMRRGAVVLLVIPLCGCMAGQTKTFAACQTESMARHFGQRQVVAPREVETCMKVHGFMLRVSKYCHFDAISAVKLLCYQPDTWLGQVGYEIEMALRFNEASYPE